ncbi:MAG TPA: aminopeptidase [Bacteriovoracaceae bacterium]|nr:aminopeptidase [Bacteriovoracaceae bacterium]
MKYFQLLFLLSLLSCSQLSYLTEQGFSQFKLQWSGEDNEKILRDPKVDKETKRKITLIQDYKKFFYNYFDKKETRIYSKTSILKQEAVSYLLIASPRTKIESHKFSFPFFGEFPYLGFFNKESALAYGERLEKKGLSIYIRPVYAYSTLGYLEDRILSSFFYYEDLDLAELIFHELFHTIFFIKNDVDLNENLANYFGKELVKIYFKDDPRLEEYKKSLGHDKIVSKKIVDMIHILESEFAKLSTHLTDKKADEITEGFVHGVFLPELRAFCDERGISRRVCMSETMWNQARFAAFLTYEEEQDLISDLQMKLQLSFDDFYQWLVKEYKVFKKTDSDSFTEYLRERAYK